MKCYWLLLLAIILLHASPAQAQEATPVITDDQVNAIARKLYCPVCENIPLDVCPTQACAVWRDEIRLQLSQGKTEEQIIQSFVGRYGDRVLGTPPTPTFIITDDQVNAIAKKLYCPVCENISLDVCPTPACADWREEIRLKLSQGQTEKQIIEYFVDRYGDRVLGAPPARGLNWLVYILPPVMIAVGVFVLSRTFRTWKRTTLQPAAEASVSPPPDDEYIQRLEEQLKRSDQ